MPKNGDVTKCENWREIMLLSVTRKIFTKITMNRIKEKIEERTSRFRKSSCMDQIFIMKNVIE